MRMGDIQGQPIQVITFAVTYENQFYCILSLSLISDDVTQPKIKSHARVK